MNKVLHARIGADFAIAVITLRSEDGLADLHNVLLGDKLRHGQKPTIYIHVRALGGGSLRCRLLLAWHKYYFPSLLQLPAHKLRIACS